VILRVELLHSLLEIAGRDDVVPVEDLACLVAGELHRDALRHARRHEVAHGATPQVVRNAARLSSPSARGSFQMLPACRKSYRFPVPYFLVSAAASSSNRPVTFVPYASFSNSHDAATLPIL
jgi:hypothetical protein